MLPLKDDIPTRRFPVLTVAIIVACCAVYFLWQHGGWDLGTTGNERVLEYGAIPYEITHPGKECGVTSDGQIACEGQAGVSGPAPEQAAWWITLFTSMFMHGSLLHLGGNMLFLWIFGNNIEDSMGRLTFVAFYILGGLAALGVHVLSDPDSGVPVVGASGAIAAVLGAYFVLYPNSRVLTLVFVFFVRIPAWVFLGVWFLYQFVEGNFGLLSASANGGGVAFFAHVGGFLFGFYVGRLAAGVASRRSPSAAMT